VCIFGSKVGIEQGLKLKFIGGPHFKKKKRFAGHSLLKKAFAGRNLQDKPSK
jgi:hypothetical protein